MLDGYVLALMAGAAGISSGIGCIAGAQNTPRLGSAWADGPMLIAFGVAVSIVVGVGLTPRYARRPKTQLFAPALASFAAAAPTIAHMLLAKRQMITGFERWRLAVGHDRAVRAARPRCRAARQDDDPSNRRGTELDPALRSAGSRRPSSSSADQPHFVLTARAMLA